MTKALCLSAVLFWWEMVSYQLSCPLEAKPSNFIYVLNLLAGADIIRLSVGKQAFMAGLASQLTFLCQFLNTGGLHHSLATNMLTVGRMSVLLGSLQ